MSLVTLEPNDTEGDVAEYGARADGLQGNFCDSHGLLFLPPSFLIQSRRPCVGRSTAAALWEGGFRAQAGFGCSSECKELNSVSMGGWGAVPETMGD